jgi:hypothetical protein
MVIVMSLNIEQFRFLIDHIKKLFEDHKARYFFDTGNRIELVLTDQQETNRLTKQLNVKENELDFTLKMEIPALILAGINGDRSQLDFLYRIDEDDKPKKEEKEKLIEEKLKIVSDILVTQKMRNSFLLKKTSKINFISGVDWEVNTKTFDDGEGKVPNLKYSILKFNLSSAERISQYWPLYPSFPAAQKAFER